MTAARRISWVVGAVLVLATAGCTGDAPTTPTSSSSSGQSSARTTAGTGPSDPATPATEDPAVGTTPADPTGTRTDPSPAPSGSTSPAPASTPTTTGGDIHQTVEPLEVSTAAPVPLTEEADFGDAVEAGITGMSATQVQARFPGESGGPGVRLDVQIRNGSDAPIDLGTVIVAVFDSAGAPAQPASAQDGVEPVAGQLAAGGTASGSYVFVLPPDARSDVRVEISYAADRPVVAFKGDLPR